MLARHFPLANPAALAAGSDGLYAISGRRLVELDPVAGSVRREIAALAGVSGGLAVGDDGKFYVSDDRLHVVQILDPKGIPAGRIGKDGGITQGTDKVVAGPYDPLQLYQPAGLALGPDGHLWVTEADRWQPKRFAAYDPKTRTVWKEWFGPTAYGASNGFPSGGCQRWIGQGAVQTRFFGKDGDAVAMRGGEEGRTYRFWRQEGRTFGLPAGR